MATTTDQFLSKLEAFAATLDANEQAMLAHLLSDDDEVSGFGFAPDGRPTPIVSGPIPIPYPNLRLRIDAFVAPQAAGTISGVLGGDANKGEI